MNKEAPARDFPLQPLHVASWAVLVAIVAASDITDEPADAALARLGLRLCQQEPAE